MAKNTGSEPAVEKVETVAVPATPENAALAQKLDTLETLLREQRDAQNKTARTKRLQSVLLAALVVVLAGGLLWLNLTVANATRELPALVETTTRTVQQTGDGLQDVLAEIEKVDFEALNTAIQDLQAGIAEMDFKALSQSVEALQAAAERLRNFLDFLG